MELQHDLKIEERRIEEATLFFWCICGRWSGSSPTLHRGPIYEGFLEHLSDVQAGAFDRPGMAL